MSRDRRHPAGTYYGLPRGCPQRQSKRDFVRAKRPPWRAIGGLAIAGIAAVVAGVFVSPWLIAVGALFLLVVPFGFLLAAPPLPERRYDLISDAISLAITRTGRSRRDGDPTSWRDSTPRSHDEGE